MTGLVCTSELVCRVPSALDAACAERQPCAFPWTCSNARCSAALVAGAACDPVGDRCDRYAGLACGGLASSTCNRWLVASAGQACGNTPAGWAECGAAGRCRVAAGAAMGTCDSHAADGGACAEGTAGPTCLSPARCVGGVCRLPVAGECS
jgi:hypothetical protein